MSHPSSPLSSRRAAPRSLPHPLAAPGRRAWLAAAAAAALLAACGGGDSSGTPGGCSSGMYGSGCPGVGYTATRLVADTAGAAPHTDAHLVNAWGVAFNPTGFAWVANNGTATSTLYDGAGVPQSLVVTLPAGTAPTGIVFNGSADFVVTGASASGPAAFLFASEDGTLSGWSPAAAPTQALTVVDNSGTGAVYKGLAMASAGGSNRLYAADFAHARIDVFDAGFAPLTVAGGFTDPTLPAGYAPFNVQAIGGKLYVAYAKQGVAPDEQAGPGLGLVDIFDVDGHLLQHLVAAGGALNAPWGMAMAPATGFGALSGKLLVGNFGNGWIEAYDPVTGAHAGTVSDASGAPLAIDGLWGLAFGNGVNGQATTTLYYAAGPADESHGAYGRIDAN